MRIRGILYCRLFSMTHHPDVQLYLIDYYSKGCIEGLNIKITLSGETVGKAQRVRF